GCVVGTAPSTGCRSNQDGQVLCLCDAEYCNRDQLVLKATPPTPLALKFALENGTKGYSHSKDCSNGSDFDLFYSQLPFIFYPETCARLEYGGQPDETRCYGSMVSICKE
ncbi:hypothetical protein OESDEN_19294, partial [Oesophagostomum dentatum]